MYIPCLVSPTISVNYILCSLKQSSLKQSTYVTPIHELIPIRVYVTLITSLPSLSSQKHNIDSKKDMTFLTWASLQMHVGKNHFGSLLWIKSIANIAPSTTTLERDEYLHFNEEYSSTLKYPALLITLIKKLETSHYKK